MLVCIAGGNVEMDEKQETVLSVLIPLYNCEKQIERAILSVLKNNCDNFEILVIDDGSKDRSGEIVRELAKKFKQIKYIKQENENNIYSVRKKLIEKAEGKYLIFLDSDDYWEDNAFQVIAEKIKENVDVILFDHKIVKGNEIKVCHKDYENEIGARGIAGLCLQLCSNNRYNALWNKCFKKELFLNNDFFKEETMNMGEDAVLSLIMLKKAKSLDWISEPIYNYVLNSSSISSKYKLSYYYDFKILYRYMKDVSCALGIQDEAYGNIAKQYIKMMSLIFLFVKIKGKEDKKEYKNKLRDLKNDKIYVSSYQNYKKEIPTYLRLLGNWIIKNRFCLIKFANFILQISAIKRLFFKVAGGKK